MALLQCKTCRKEIYSDETLVKVESDYYCSSACHEVQVIRKLLMQKEDSLRKQLADAEAIALKLATADIALRNQIEIAQKYEDRFFETKAKLAEVIAENEELSQKVCDECLDGSPEEYPNTYGWNYNRVEGWHSCSCVEESGPYQQLKDKLAEATEERDNLKEIGQELYDHLDYCGWGDSWERECSEDLQEKARKIFD